jgi:hypothetical protein
MLLGGFVGISSAEIVSPVISHWWEDRQEHARFLRDAPTPLEGAHANRAVEVFRASGR